MKLKFLGHASFLITSEKGVRVITDPYRPGCFDGGIRYEPITEKADIVTVSHEHDDHNCPDIAGDPAFVRGAGRHEIKGIQINGIELFHDESGGKQRGKNTVFNMAIDGMHVVHLGDLGHMLIDDDIKKIGPVDILLIPVGGYFTIGARAADDIVTKLRPRIVVPMHFKTAKCDFPIAPVDEYVGNKDVQKCEGECDINKDTLPARTRIYVMTPTK